MIDESRPNSSASRRARQAASPARGLYYSNHRSMSQKSIHADKCVSPQNRIESPHALSRKKRPQGMLRAGDGTCYGFPYMLVEALERIAAVGWRPIGWASRRSGGLSLSHLTFSSKKGRMPMLTISRSTTHPHLMASGALKYAR